MHPHDWRTRVRRWLGPLPLADVLWGTFFLLSALGTLTFLVDYGPSPTYLLNTALELALAAAAFLRRRRLVASFLATYLLLAAYGALVWLTPLNLGVSPIILTAPLSLWAVTRWAPSRLWGALGLVFGVAGAMVNPMVPAFGFSPERLLIFGLPAVVAVALVYVIALWLHTTAEQNHAQIQAARQEQRLALSRELHDVVGHGLTSIKIQASTALYLEDHRGALGAIADTADAALDDVHSLVDALRDDALVSADPVEIPVLIERSGADVDAELPNDWSPAHDWPLHLRLVLVRTLTEAVTNMARHATGPGTLSLSLDEEGFRLVTVNPGVEKRGSGFGLKGMSERVTQAGGTMTSGWDDGQFRLEVSV